MLAHAFREVPPQLQRRLSLKALKMTEQRTAWRDEVEDEGPSPQFLLLHSHLRDLPAWLLELPALDDLRVGGCVPVGAFQPLLLVCAGCGGRIPTAVRDGGGAAGLCWIGDV